MTARPLLFRPLAIRRVRLLWGGLTLSALGDQFYSVALIWVAVIAFGPAAGYLTALQAACGLGASLLVGRWADRWDQCRALVGADTVRAAVLLLLVAWWMASGRPPAMGLALTILVLAVAEAVFEPALAATLPVLLPDPPLLPAANALFDTTNRSARLIGPGLVALLATAVPVMHFFTLDAASFLLSAAAVLAMGQVRVAAIGARTTWQAGIAHGFAAVRRHRLLWSMLVFKTGGGSFWYAAYYLALPLAIDQAHIAGPGGAGLGAYGLVISAYGCTNLLSTLVVGSRAMPAHPGRMVFCGSLISGLGIVGLALGAVTGLPTLMLAAALGAVSGPMGDIPVAVLRQTELAAGDVAPATRAFMVVRFGGTLVSMLVAPALAQRAGAPALLLICGLGSLAFAGTGLSKHWSDGKGLRRLETPPI